MKNQPRFPGTLRAKAFHKEDGSPALEIDIEEMARLEKLLREKLGREPTTIDLFNYVYEAQKQ